MFANAYKLVSKFTHPVIISTRFFNKTVKCGCGVFIVVNDKGWIVTVAHIFNPSFKVKEDQKKIDEYKKRKCKLMKSLKTNLEWITNFSFWWGGNRIQLKNLKLLPKGDLAIGRLEPFNSKKISVFPVFKNPSLNLNVGTSLCKLGFPFYKIKATFNEKTNEFKLAPNTLPLPRFPIEGIYTRNIVAGKSQDGKYEIKFLETSSPGLRGQSGGPIFDVKGRIWSIQSRTHHFELGFSPKVKKKDGREVEENQFLNVGLGVHPELLVSFLRDNQVDFNLSED